MGLSNLMKEEIKKIFKGEVADDEATILMYSHDASLLEVRPKVVVYPKDAQDVKNLVKWVDENKNKYKDPKKKRLEKFIYYRSLRGDRHVWWSHRRVYNNGFHEAYE